MTLKKTLSADEIAARLGISRASTYRLIASKRIPPAVAAADLESVTRRTCAHCKQPFNSTDSRQRFCSAHCRFNASNQRKRERKKTRAASESQPVRSLDIKKAPVRLQAALLASKRPHN